MMEFEQNSQKKQAALTLSLQALKEFLKQHGFPSYRADQVFNWIYVQGCDDFLAMKNLPKGLTQLLDQHFMFPQVYIETFTSSDGTIKYRFKFSDGASIESVWMPEEHRATLCVSSQVGCALKCAFCVTGTLGLKRNLSTPEILYQVWYVAKKQKLKLSNLVFMGMGEPLQNAMHLIEAIDALKDPEKYGFGRRKITVSTVGLANRIKDFIQKSDVNLAVSLTGFNDEDRNYWMPINKTFNLKRLKHELSGLGLGKGKKITFEVVLIKDRTDRPQDAHDLADFLSGLPAKVNLIPYNENNVLPDLKEPLAQSIAIFRNILKQKGVLSMVRKNRGQDIMGACGQLAAKNID